MGYPVEPPVSEQRWYVARLAILMAGEGQQPISYDSFQQQLRGSSNLLFSELNVQHHLETPLRYNHQNPQGTWESRVFQAAELQLNLAEAASLQFCRQHGRPPTVYEEVDAIKQMILERHRLRVLDPDLLLSPGAEGRYPIAMQRYRQREAIQEEAKSLAEKQKVLAPHEQLIDYESVRPPIRVEDIEGSTRFTENRVARAVDPTSKVASQTLEDQIQANKTLPPVPMSEHSALRQKIVNKKVENRLLALERDSQRPLLRAPAHLEFLYVVNPESGEGESYPNPYYDPAAEEAYFASLASRNKKRASEASPSTTSTGPMGSTVDTVPTQPSVYRSPFLPQAERPSTPVEVAAKAAVNLVDSPPPPETATGSSSGVSRTTSALPAQSQSPMTTRAMARREQSQASALPVIIHQRSEHLLIDLLEDYGGRFTLDTLAELERDYLQAKSDNTSTTWSLRTHLTEHSLQYMENIYFNLLHDGVPLEERMLTDEERRTWKDREPTKVFNFLRYCVTSQSTGFTFTSSASLAQQMSTFTFVAYDLANVFNDMMRIQYDLMAMAGTRVDENDAEEIKKCLNKWEQTHSNNVQALDLIGKIRAKKPRSVQDIIKAIFDHGVTAMKYKSYLTPKVPPTSSLPRAVQPVAANVPTVQYLVPQPVVAPPEPKHIRGSQKRGKGPKRTQSGGIKLSTEGTAPVVYNAPVPTVPQPYVVPGQPAVPAPIQGAPAALTVPTQQGQPYRQVLRSVANSPFPEPNGINDPCRVCGSTKDTKPAGSHGPDNCPFRNHPNANHSSIAWAQSSQGLQWKMLQPKGSLWIPRGWQIVNGTLQPYDGPPRSGKPGTPSGTSGKKCKSNIQTCLTCIESTSPSQRQCSCEHDTPDLDAVTPNSSVEFLLHMDNYLKNVHPSKANDFVVAFVCDRNLNNSLPVSALLDTGALNNSYISPRVARWLVDKHVAQINPCNTNICGINDKLCVKCLGVIKITLHLKSELSNEFFYLNTEASIIDAAFDVLLGRPDIKKHNLVVHFPSQFRSIESQLDSTLAERPVNTHSAREVSPESNKRPDQSCKSKQARGNVERVLFMNVKSKEELLGETPEEAQEEWLKQPSDIATVLPALNPTEQDPLDLIRFHGPPELQSELRTLCEEYRHIFSTTLRPRNADVPAMKLHVNREEWIQKKNRRGPRPLSAQKMAALDEQLNELLRLGIIQPSKAQAWSQILLVPKPNGKVRLCIDFRALNACSRGEH